MSIATVVTGGFGNGTFSTTIALVVTGGYGIGEDLAPDVCFVGFQGKLTDSNGTEGKLLDSIGFVGILDVGPNGTIGVLKSIEGFSGKLTDSDGSQGKLTDTEGFQGELCD